MCVCISSRLLSRVNELDKSSEMLVLADYTHNYENQILDEQSQDVQKKTQAQPIVDTVTESGGVKVEDESLFLLDSPGHTVDGLPAYDSVIEPTPTSSSSLSSSSCLSYPSFGSNALIISDTLSDEIMSTIVDTSPNFIPYNNASTPKELGMPCSSQPLADSCRVAPQIDRLAFPSGLCTPAQEESFCPKEDLNHLPNLQAVLLNEPSYEQKLPPSAHMLATSADSFTYPFTQRSHPKATSNHVASPQASLLIDPKHEQQQVRPPLMASTMHQQQVLHGQSYVTPDGFNINGIVPQDSIGNFFEGGYPKSTYVLTDCSDVLVGSRRQHHPLLQSSLSVLRGPGHLPSMPRYHSYNNLDARECFPLHHAAKIDDFMLSPGPSIMYSKSKAKPTSFYTPEDLQDLSLAGIEILSDQHSSAVQEIRPYTKDEKSKRIERYRQKRNERNFNKKIKYACRKTLADSRPRIKGRFARTDDT